MLLYLNQKKKLFPQCLARKPERYSLVCFTGHESLAASSSVHTKAGGQEFRTQLSKCVLSAQSLSRVRLFATPWTVDRQAPLSMEFLRQEYQSGLPFPSSRDLPPPGMKLTLLLGRQILYHRATWEAPPVMCLRGYSHKQDEHRSVLVEFTVKLGIQSTNN